MRRLPVTQWKEPPTCTCKTCKSMCQSPCYPSPTEAKKLIKLGYADKLMLCSRSLPKGRSVALLAPARKGAQGRASYESLKGCSLQFRGKCKIHTICKPIEGRLADCRRRDGGFPIELRDAVSKMWDNDSARRLVKSWIKKYAKEPEILFDVFREELTLRDSKRKSAHAKTSTASGTSNQPSVRSRPSSR